MEEQEIQARVRFKLNDISDAISNSIKRNSALSFVVLDRDPSLSQKHVYYKEAYQEFSKIFHKEIESETPSDHMHQRNLDDVKNRIIDEVIGEFERLRRKTNLHPETTMLFTKFLVQSLEKNRI